MKSLSVLAFKEIRDGLRNRWIAVMIAVLAGLALLLALIGSAPAGAVKASLLSVTVVSLAALSVYLLPLIALILAYDAIVGEAESGTLALLLSYPLARGQVILGKFLGHLVILALAICLGFGIAALAVAALGGADAAGWWAFLGLCASATLLGAAFLALGYLLSALCKARATAAGIAIGVWLFLVVLYDLGLLGLLLLDRDQALGQGLVATLLLVNPTDAFRLFNLTLLESAREIGGLIALGPEATPAPATLLATLALWTFAALIGAEAAFARREI